MRRSRTAAAMLGAAMMVSLVAGPASAGDVDVGPATWGEHGRAIFLKAQGPLEDVGITVHGTFAGELTRCNGRTHRISGSTHRFGRYGTTFSIGHVPTRCAVTLYAWSTDEHRISGFVEVDSTP